MTLVESSTKIPSSLPHHPKASLMRKISAPTKKKLIPGLASPLGKDPWNRKIVHNDFSSQFAQSIAKGNIRARRKTSLWQHLGEADIAQTPSENQSYKTTLIKWWSGEFLGKLLPGQQQENRFKEFNMRQAHSTISDISAAVS